MSKDQVLKVTKNKNVERNRVWIVSCLRKVQVDNAVDKQLKIRFRVKEELVVRRWMSWLQNTRRWSIESLLHTAREREEITM